MQMMKVGKDIQTKLTRMYYRFFGLCNSMILKLFYLYTNHKTKCKIMRKANKQNNNVPWCAFCPYHINKYGYCNYVCDGSECWDCDKNPPDIDEGYDCLFSGLRYLLLEYINRNNIEN